MPVALNPWYTALATRGSTPADVVVIGDSISEGQGATARDKRWIWRFRDLLRAKYPVGGVAGGDGYIATTSYEDSYPTGWTYAGNQVLVGGQYGFSRRNLALGAGTPPGSCTRTVFGTSITVAYTRVNSGLGSFSVFLDGSATPAVTVDTTAGASGTVQDDGRVSVPLGGRGSHTVKIEHAAGPSVYVSGIYVYDQDETRGVRLTDSAENGSSSASWSSGATPSIYTLDGNLAILQPDLVVIELGSNDLLQGIPSATYKNNILELISRVRGASTPTPAVLLIAAYRIAGTWAEPWANYVQQLRDIAAANSSIVTLLDLSTVMPVSSDTALGYYAGDGQHPSDLGHDFIAHRVLDVLEFAVPATALTVATSSETGTVLPAPPNGDNSNGNSFGNSGKQLVLLQNTGGSSATAQVTFPYKVRNQTIPSLPISVPAGATALCGPYDPSIYGDTVVITPSAATLKPQVIQSA